MSKVVVSGVVTQAGKILIAKRKWRTPEDEYGGLWEHPGGKVEVGETKLMALQRELGEELTIHVNTANMMFIGKHVHEDYEIHGYEISVFKGDPQPIVTSELKWATVDECFSLKAMPSFVPMTKMYTRMLKR